MENNMDEKELIMRISKLRNFRYGLRMIDKEL